MHELSVSAMWCTLRWPQVTDVGVCVCGQKRPLLLYKMFVHELLATQSTVVPRKLFKTSGLALHQTIMAWPWDKKTSAMCTAEDIVALALGGIGGQAVSRGDTKFRARFAEVFNQGADKHTAAALGLGAAGDTAWPEEESDLSVVRTVLSDPRRDVVLNVWHFNPAVGDSVEGMTSARGKSVSSRLANPPADGDDAPPPPPQYRPFGPLIPVLLTTAWSHFNLGLFDALLPPAGFPDLSPEAQEAEVQKRLALQHTNLCSPEEKLSYHSLFNEDYWKLRKKGTATDPAIDLSAPQYTATPVLGPHMFAAMDALILGVGSGSSAWALLPTQKARHDAYNERVSFWEEHWKAVPAMLLAAWRRHDSPLRTRKRHAAGDIVRGYHEHPKKTVDDERTASDTDGGDERGSDSGGIEDRAGGGAGGHDRRGDVGGAGPRSSRGHGSSSRSKKPRQAHKHAKIPSPTETVKAEALAYFRSEGLPGYDRVDSIDDDNPELQRYLLRRAYRIFVACMMTQACMARLVQGGLDEAVVARLGCPVEAVFGIAVSAETLELCHETSAPKTPGQWRLVADRLETYRARQDYFEGQPADHPFPDSMSKWSAFMWYMFTADNLTGVLMRRMCR